MKAAHDGKTRFSNRVDDYVKWRPSYPKEAIDALFEKLGMRKSSIVADVGSGTGIMTRLLAGRFDLVYALEPNKAMREVAEKELAGSPSFRSLGASAENTTLPDASVDLIVCAQAFHWFDRAACEKEFSRILRPGGLVALIWNKRLASNPFSEAYEDFLKKSCPEYGAVSHTKLSDADFAEFFDKDGFRRMEFQNKQLLAFEGLLGRSVSSSYAPARGSASFEPFESGLRALFDKFNENGFVELPYRAELTWGRP